MKVLATRADNLERTQLRTLIDNLRNKLGSGVVVLGSVSDGKVALIVGVTKDLTSRVQAGKIIAEVAKKVGGSGGGRPDMAEAGGKDPAALDPRWPRATRCRTASARRFTTEARRHREIEIRKALGRMVKSPST